MLEAVKNLLNFALDKFLSKKLLAFAVATLLLWFGKVSEDVWEMIAIAFIGIQGSVDALLGWKHGVSKSNGSNASSAASTTAPGAKPSATTSATPVAAVKPAPTVATPPVSTVKPSPPSDEKGP